MPQSLCRRARAAIRCFRAAEPKSEIAPVPRPCIAKAKSQAVAGREYLARQTKGTHVEAGMQPAVLGPDHGLEESH